MSSGHGRSSGQWLALAMVALLSGCALGGPVTDACLVTSPIWISRADVLSDGTARQVLQHNETWADLCGDIRSDGR